MPGRLLLLVHPFLHGIHFLFNLFGGFVNRNDKVENEFIQYIYDKQLKN